MSQQDSEVTAADFLPESLSLAALKRAVQGCRGCPLYHDASQAVFGEGLKRSRLMLVGEMPGDGEDRAGKPFVGPAGRILDAALDEAGIERKDAYVTNVVKHFKWERRGRRRLHKTPNAREVRACLPWLEAEIDLVQPDAFVCLGATAAKSLLGSDFRVTRQHGQLLETRLARHTMATAHPSSVLRKPDREQRERAMQELVADLKRLGGVLNGG